MYRKTFFSFVLLLLTLTFFPTTSLAQTQAVVDTTQLRVDKAKFLYGFYQAYMSGTLYDVDGLPELLQKTYFTKDFQRRLAAQEMLDADPLLDAQDCIEENRRTLSVSPINNDWYCVAFFWTSPYLDVPTRLQLIEVKVIETLEGFRIDDAKGKSRDLK